MIKDAIAAILITVLLLSFMPNKNVKEIESVVENHSMENKSINTKFEFPIDSFHIETIPITKDLYFGTLLNRCNISTDKIIKILEKAKSVFDIRKLRAGNAFTIFRSTDSINRVKYIVYQQDAVNYTVFDFNDSLNVYNRQKEVTIKQRAIGGIITNCLWFAMADNGIDPKFANDLSEIFSWTIDFFGIQPGDKFKAVFDERFVDSTFVGFGKIHSAWFEHNGKEIYAIPFYQDSTESYFDKDGASLKRAFLKAPLKYSRIASGFSGSRLHPILKIYRPHHGVDYCAPVGTPVMSIGDGTVISVGYQEQAGKMVKIRHNSVYSTSYLHLSGYAAGIQSGSKVSQGQVIGYVGSTGLSTGPHLDFRVYKNGTAINPLKMDAPATDPIKPENLAEFEKAKDKYIIQLQNIIIQPQIAK